MKPAKHKFSILKQVCEYIPRNLTPKLSKKYKIQSRSFSPWSHIVSLVHCQLSHSVSLNDISDCLRHHSGVLTTIRGATAPSRNGLSHANRTRDAQMAEDLFWQTLYAFQKQSPGFSCGRNYCGLPRRFKRTIHSVDSTTISLVANCLDWAKHRRRKAAAKCHMRLDVQSFLPSFAIVKSAGTHDSTEAKELCAGVKAGEIIVFDNAYVDYKHLHHNENAVRWQIWTALLTYVILRFIAYQSTWKASFTRLFTAIRGVLWSRIELYSLLKFCGTAVGKPRMVAVP